MSLPTGLATASGRLRLIGVLLTGICLASASACQQSESSPAEAAEQSRADIRLAVAPRPDTNASEDTNPGKNADTEEVAEQIEATPYTKQGTITTGEYWDATYIGDSKVGHFHTQIIPVEDGERKLLKIAQDGQLTVTRFGTKITQQMASASVETPEGEVVRCESVINMGPSPLRVRADVVDRSLEVSLNSFGKWTKKTMTWNPDWGGFFAAEQAMRRKPLQPGEVRRFKALTSMGTDVAVAEVTLTAHDYETVDLLDGQRKLLKVSVKQDVDGPADMDTTAWVNEDGEAIKQFMPGMKLTTYRVDRAKALGEPDTGFNLDEIAVVKLSRPIIGGHGRKQITYKVKQENGDPADFFPNCGSQQVKSLDDNTAEVVVSAVRPDSPASLPVKPTPPTDKDLAPNNLVQSDDERVVQLAREVSPRETDAWTLAKDLERSVYKSMKSKNFETAFATAAEVARSLEGDCSEHAVLLAAMCRARKIPARVAVGLVYYPPERGFAFHVWNEVWIKDRWVPLDATLGQGGIGAAHLKLADSDLDGADAYSPFLPVAKVMGQLKIEVIGVK